MLLLSEEAVSIAYISKASLSLALHGAVTVVAPDGPPLIPGFRPKEGFIEVEGEHAPGSSVQGEMHVEQQDIGLYYQVRDDGLLWLL